MKITCVVGARPQFVKLAPFLRAAKSLKHNVRIVHTGQHYDENLSNVFFKDLGMPAPDLNLGIGSDTQAKQTARMLQGLEKELLENMPEWVIVFGDTNSTLAGSLAASKIGVKVAHVEAGLRSYNRSMPEEINRIISDHICDLLFVPSEQGMANLRKEGIEERAIRTGDLMADVLIHFQDKLPDDIFTKLNIKQNDYYLLTLHRPASVDEGAMLNWMIKQASKLEKTVIFPVHPRTQQSIEREKINLNKYIKLIPPLGYLDFQALMSKAIAVLTDSGGIQKEAYIWKVPCFTLRTETEWNETIETGWNTLVRPKKDEITEAVNQWKRPSAHPSLYGNGNSAKDIIMALTQVRL